MKFFAMKFSRNPRSQTIGTIVAHETPKKSSHMENDLHRSKPLQKAMLIAMIENAIMIEFLPPNMCVYFNGIDIEHSRLILIRRCRRIIG